jgi:hypothetical protein
LGKQLGKKKGVGGGVETNPVKQSVSSVSGEETRHLLTQKKKKTLKQKRNDRNTYASKADGQRRKTEQENKYALPLIEKRKINGQRTGLFFPLFFLSGARVCV